MVSTRHPLAEHVDAETIAAAIKSAEAGTGATIAVTLDHHADGKIIDSAYYAFAKLRLHHSKQRNNVLFYVWPEKREFAVIGDGGVYKRLGQAFWDDLARSVSERIKASGLTAGLVFGIEQAGIALRRSFPSAAG
jgi:uncharacterized membrane protein